MISPIAGIATDCFVAILAAGGSAAQYEKWMGSCRASDQAVGDHRRQMSTLRKSRRRVSAGVIVFGGGNGAGFRERAGEIVVKTSFNSKLAY
jgi:hypothetical protein